MCDSQTLRRKRVLIYGKGLSGEAAARLCEKKGLNYKLVEDKDFTEETLNEIDIVVVSPGIPFFHPIFKLCKRRKIPVISEIDFASFFWEGKVIAITGTDGKSTTTKIVYDILRLYKKDVFIGGNYGIPFSDIVIEKNRGIAVLELSSFQIYSTKFLKPDTGVFLNISEDHLNWHKKFRHYLYSKIRLFKNLNRNSLAVINKDDFFSSCITTEGKKVYFSLKALEENEEGIFLRDGFLWIKKGKNVEKFLDVKEIPVAGIHNIQNVMAATLVCLNEGLSKDKIVKGIKSFEPLPYRLEYKGKVKGVDVYNDAKSTTVQSLKMAVKSFPEKKVIVIAGGINKGGDFSILKEEKNIKGFVLIGKDKESIKNMVESYFHVKTADSLEEALKKALLIAEKDDVIVFSPGCASFDMFKNYIDRGESFNKVLKGFLND